jgi:hypothetical protein
VLIDVQDLQVRILNADGSMTAGSGQRWENVYDFLDSHDLGAVGGRHDGVGIAGFLLGVRMSTTYYVFLSCIKARHKNANPYRGHVLLS